MYIHTFPTVGKEWVMRHHPGSLIDTVQLVENFVASEEPPNKGKQGDNTGLRSCSNVKPSQERPTSASQGQVLSFSDSQQLR